MDLLDNAGTLTLLAGTGVPGFAGDGGPGPRGPTSGPTAPESGPRESQEPPGGSQEVSTASPRAAQSDLNKTPDHRKESGSPPGGSLEQCWNLA